MMGQPANRGGDTIAALSSGGLLTGVAVIRISGPRARLAVETVFGILPLPRVATLGRFRSASGETIDTGLALFFPAPRSFTGEDCAEFHSHGGRAVVSRLLKEIQAVAECRLAEPGEFSRRAMHNGKIDLLEAEATADLISAETEAQRQFAETNRGGGNAALYESWRRNLIELRSRIEAALDFADEDDGIGPDDGFAPRLDELISEIAKHVSGYAKTELVTAGFNIVLVGAPNVGKSSLLNAIAGREVAIVTDEPGTTRDALEVTIDLRGYKVRFTDTAGIREAQGLAEKIGIGRTLERSAAADLLVHLSVVGSAAELLPTLPTYGSPVLKVGTKQDLAGSRSRRSVANDLEVSSKTGYGLDEFMSYIGAIVESAAPAAGETLPWRLRHVELLEQGLGHMKNALVAGRPLEIVAEDLRLASDALGRITGSVDVEDLLDVIFSQFCIGK